MTAWIAAVVLFAVHALANAHYGFFRDELYFIVCGRHPQWGYVDQPPVVPLLAAATQLFGASLFLLRIVPALFAAAGIFTTCTLTAELGGGAFAQSIAALAFGFAPVLLSFGQKAGPDEVGLWTWPLLALLCVRMAKGASPKLWLWAGAVAGLSLESKYTVAFFLAALVLGLALTPQRRLLANRWFAGGCALALVLASPNVLWQASYGFPMWELLRAGQEDKNVAVGPGLYLLQELLITGVFLAPVWIVGVVRLLRAPAYRFLGIAYVALIVAMLVLHGKHYYPADVYPVLLAAGGVQLEGWTSEAPFARAALLAYAVVLGPLFVPFSLPLLPEGRFLAYQQRLAGVLPGLNATLATEHGREAQPLPGDWADMHGWPELAAAVSRVYDGLPPADRAVAVAVASNYGEAAAIAFFAPHVPVVSGHNQYWLWGPRGYSGNVTIDVNGDCGAAGRLFRSATLAARVDTPYAIGYERNLPIKLCRGIAVPLATLWPQLKRYR